jgi:alkanesulfonate monooxygenase SsuD/methylene tetrahydromethanopterin reductase-like flavin-dependent oxidoreductase (luciferase family)
MTSFGFPFDRRADRFEEALQIITSLLRRGHLDFRGRYYQLSDCQVLPRIQMARRCWLAPLDLVCCA